MVAQATLRTAASAHPEPEICLFAKTINMKKAEPWQPRNDMLYAARRQHSFAVNITKGGTETSHYTRLVASRWKMALQDTKRHRKFKTDKRDDMLRMQVVDT